MRSSLAVIMAVAVGAAGTIVSPSVDASTLTRPASVAHVDTESEAEHSVVNAISYDIQADRFLVSEEKAADLGFGSDRIQAFQQNFNELSPQESRELAELIGIDVSALRQQRAVPVVVVAIASFIGGAAASEIISQVTNWGVSGACRNLEGRWDAFDNFCRSNGHV